MCSLFSFNHSTLHFTRYVDFVSPFWAPLFLPPEPLSPSDPPYYSFTLVVQSHVRVDYLHNRALLLCRDVIVSNTLQICLALVIRSSASAWPLYRVHQPRLLGDRVSRPSPLRLPTRSVQLVSFLLVCTSGSPNVSCLSASDLCVSRVETTELLD